MRHRLARLVALLAIALVVVAGLAGVATAFALRQTSSAQFFSEYRSLDRRYVNLGNSAHEGIGCRVCHETDALANGVELTRDYYLSLFTDEDVPRNYTFRAPTNDRCLSCHANDWTHQVGQIPHPAHTRVADEQRACTDCHKWTAHLETYMQKHKKMPFSGVCVAYGCHVGTKSTEQCFECHHVLSGSDRQWIHEHSLIVQASGQNACLENCHEVLECQTCHTTGRRPDFGPSPARVSAEIETLHVSTAWTQQHGRYARRDQKQCLTCHQSQGECAECHRERPKSHGSRSTWIGRHERHAKDVSDPRCVTCHKDTWCEECHKQFKEME